METATGSADSARPIAPGSIARDALWLLLGRLLAQGLTVVFTVILARRLGVAGFGAYAFVSAAVLMANVVTTFGTDMALIRDVAGAGRYDRWGAALAVQLGLSGLAILAAWALLAPVAGAALPAVVGPLRIFSLSLLPAALFSVCTAILRGAGRMRAYAALGVALPAIQLGVLWLLPADAPLEVLFVGLLGVQMLAAAMAWGLCAATSPPLRRWPRPSFADTSDMLRATGTLGILGVLGVAFQRAPVLVLATASGPSAAGLFAGASKVVETAKTGHVALFAAVYPAMARAHRPDGPGDADPALGWSWRVSLAGAALLSAAIMLASPVVLGLLLGPGFDAAGTGLAVLALSLVPSAFSTYQSLDLVARHRERATVRAQVLSLASLILLLGGLLPALGWVGGCWAVLGAEVVQSLALFVVRRKLVLGRPRPGAAVAASAGGLR